ncbi:caspase-1-like [Anthonomus grandis grandis]|uniref:caspase-1-like n=1 Tax=Anthonomus grandis grandis TaxID=2921223 RepID=UPI0021661558|nr:caspase-1-like [Anthonomus grandis grandis]XP_050303576.1 caspase-1-like [Anthonomus grandis grandis]XP_050303654.1 caspase-1-like [Anthonomus grandis grandis]
MNTIRKWIGKKYNGFFCSREEYPSSSSNKINIEVPLTQSDEYYKMDHPERGLVIVFNHEIFDNKKRFKQRMGTNEDVGKIKKTFSTMGFQVHSYKDLTLAEIRDHIKRYLEQDHYHKQRDCLVIFVLTHGEEGDFLAARDKVYDASKELWSKFTAEGCPAFAAKPKLFFLQACRGDAVDHGVSLQTSKDCFNTIDGAGGTHTDGLSYSYPNFADILICCSTIDGHTSYRSPSGSPWITILCEELEKNWKTMEIQQILTCVNRRLAVEFSSRHHDSSKTNKKQTPYIRSTLTRSLIFGRSS